jgi:SecD/SecF fusion protein
MNKQLLWKLAIVVAVLAASLFSMWPLQEKVKLGLDLKGGTSFLLQLDFEASRIESAGRADATHQAAEVIRKRVDRFGVAEPIIQPMGEGRILVQLPGLEEKRRLEARRTIERTAYLEFRLVHERNEELVAQSLTDPRFVAPVGYQKFTKEERRNGRLVKNTYFVKVRPELTGKHVTRAYVQYNDVGQPYVSMSFDPEGGRIFARVTAANVERQLAIILDGELKSAPVIREAITGGSGQITGDFSLAEARELANVLENPLEAPVKIVEERGVDPSLGHDSIRAGVRAAAIGAAAALAGMLVYYLSPGAVAVLALVFNVVILIGALAFFKFTLTLPGLAGIVLTIGMSVDANVLIYERIREELAANKPLRAAIAAGYQRAWLVIFDSNFTTILTAALLIWMGSGPVKGFGVTLAIGLMANLFTAVFFTRIVFEWLAGQGLMKSFPMLSLIPKTKFNFLGSRLATFALSAIVIVTGAVFFVKEGGLQIGKGAIYGIDFAGGDTVTLAFTRKVNPEEIGRALNRAGVPERFIQYQRDLSGGSEVLSLKLPEGVSESAAAQLEKDFPDAGFKVLKTERVGAIVGKQLFKQAGWAVAFSLLAIMLYVGFRFGEFSYGIGALVALIYGVLMCLGIFCLTARQFSMTVLAAVLTVIGYSINDTIVVYDRIREDRKLAGGRLGYFDLINRSINETLSRTVLTGGITILSTLALYAFGGTVINDFAFTFLVGVLTGTFASVFIASSIVLWFHRREAKT